MPPDLPKRSVPVGHDTSKNAALAQRQTKESLEVLLMRPFGVVCEQMKPKGRQSPKRLKVIGQCLPCGEPWVFQSPEGQKVFLICTAISIGGLGVPLTPPPPAPVRSNMFAQ